MKQAVFIFILLFIVIAAQAELPRSYQKSSAAQKQTILWNNFSTSPYESLPGLTSRLLLQAIGSPSALNLKPTLNTVSDEMPEGRIKFIHTYGSCAAVELVTIRNPFTGIFQTGAIGIARLGWAAPPELIGHIPGMAVKFLVDRKASVNIQVMHSLDGQGDNANFFAKTFSNQIKEPTNPIVGTLAGIFKLATSNPFYLPVDHLASIDRIGTEIKKFYSPETIQLVPRHPEWISKNSKDDLREVLITLRNGSVLYDVYGIKDNQQYAIGTLKLKSKFINSEYCDKKIFFQHHSVEASKE